MAVDWGQWRRDMTLLDLLAAIRDVTISAGLTPFAP